MSEQSTPDRGTAPEGGTRTAGALDVRNIIGGLLSIYGVILLVMGIFGDTAPEKTGDINANLWAGIALLVVGVGFLAWARIRPIVVKGPASGQSTTG
ncbi:hypothetical protein [Nocardioides sp. LHG3406-4]|uniref:hypothetical protein n=1 Tax=Nocardioides sp. LHG3406-4 TaxID=2804575 RepID=UPI003CF1E760